MKKSQNQKFIIPLNEYPKKKSILIASIICSLILVGLFSSYAYFQILNTNKEEKMTLKAGVLALTFNDGSASFQGNLNFGESAIKEFTIENTGTLDAAAFIEWKDLINTYTEGSLTYTLSESDSADGTYTQIGEVKNVPQSSAEEDFILSDKLTIPSKTTKYYRLTITLNYLESVNQTNDFNAILTSQFALIEEEVKELTPVSAEEILTKLGKTVKEGNPTFSSTATTNETANQLYALEDNYGTSYYYRGAATDNYVKFGKWSETSSNEANRGKDMYWRIIRINGDGSVRMIYDGTEPHANGESSTDRIAWTGQTFNSAINDNKYVGYMFGGNVGDASSKRIQLGEAGYEDSTNVLYNQTNSDVKTKLEEWYSENLLEYDDQIADSIFCNDRNFESRNTGTGYGNSTAFYGGRARSGYGDSDVTATFICPNKTDSFTKTDTNKGNGLASQKIGLITVDEIIASGSGKYNTSNSRYYLYKGSTYWSESPCSASTNAANIFYVGSNGMLNLHAATSTDAIAPVINIKSEYFNNFYGDGTIGNEFRLSTE